MPTLSLSHSVVLDGFLHYRYVVTSVMEDIVTRYRGEEVGGLRMGAQLSNVKWLQSCECRP